MGLFNFGKKKEVKGSCCAPKTTSCCSGETQQEKPCCSSNEKETSCCSSAPKQEVKAACACGSECGISDIEKARLIVLGACCKKSSESFENVKKAVDELGLSDEVKNIGDMAEIAKYGVMQTPAFVIDSKVVSVGKLITVEAAKELIASN